MSLIFRLEKGKKPICTLRKILFKYSNEIEYDSDIYSILLDYNKVIGYISKYKVPIDKSCYIDIFIFSEYRNKGYGSTSLTIFIDNFLSDYNEIYIRSNQPDKNRFLLKNKFVLLEDNLNKNLYYLENSSKGD